MVACPHALASEAGVEILKAGGSAVDAAVAASAVLSVVYPHMTSVGGDAFWLIYHASDRAVRFLNAAGRAAASADVAWFQARGLAEIPLRLLPRDITVAGAVDGWAGRTTTGRLTLGRDLAAATSTRRDGFPVTRRRPLDAMAADDLPPSTTRRRAANLPTVAPSAGQRLRNTDMPGRFPPPPPPEQIAASAARAYTKECERRRRWRATHGATGFFDRDAGTSPASARRGGETLHGPSRRHDLRDAAAEPGRSCSRSPS